MTIQAIKESCKLACRISSNAIDDEILDIINSAFYDLEISGVSTAEGEPYSASNADQLVITAIKTYVKLHLGDLLSDNEANRLTMAYNDQKATLKMRNYSDSTYHEEEES